MNENVVCVPFVEDIPTTSGTPSLGMSRRDYVLALISYEEMVELDKLGIRVLGIDCE